MAANTTNFTLNTDLNTNPYYDDFDVEKNFHRLLFKPSTAVQARELTQMQTMLQSQIDKFAEHIFKEGSLVSGGQFFIDTSLPYVKINDTTPIGGSVNVENLVGETMTGTINGVKAYVVTSEEGTQSGANTKTLFVRYTSSGSDGEINKFAVDEILTSPSGNAVVHSSNNAIGIGSMFTIEKGVVFSKDHFISFPRQTVILDRYSESPTCKVGFNINERVVTALDDNTLNDPAMGSYNYAAPGADRLELTAELVTTAIDDVYGPPNFVELFQIIDGVVQVKYELPQYSLIRNELARRTFDESGDYYVRGLNVRIREHLDNGSNQGLYTSAEGGNTSFLVAGVEPGLAYIKGFDIETLVTKYVDVRKATDLQQIENQITNTRMGSFVTCNEVVGSWDLNVGETIRLYDTAQARLTNEMWSTGAPAGNLLGTAKVRGIELVNGVAGTPEAEYNVYLFDVQMTNGDFASVRSLYKDNASTADIGADVVLSVGNTAIMGDTAYDAPIYYIGNAVKSIRDASNNVDTTFSFKKSFPISIASSGTFTINSSDTSEVFPYSAGLLTDLEKKDIIISLNAPATKTLPGTVATGSGSDTVTGTGTSFSRLNVGDKISIATVTGTYFIKEIISDTSMKLTKNTSNAVSGQVMTKQYKTGDILNMTGNGADSGADRTINLNSETSLTFDLKETLSGTISATATVKMTKKTARETAKLLKPNRFVKIDCSTAGTTGPFNLGFADVFKIRSVRVKTGAFSSSGEGSDVTESFKFDNGQKDRFYDHATITPLMSLAPTDHLLVELDYFEPNFTQGLGYFSVDSYPVNDVSPSSTQITTQQIPLFRSPTSGLVYDLRNVMDFRPVKSATATDATTVALASTNPVTTSSFASPSGGLHFPAVNGQIVYDYSYYMPRTDLIVMDNTGTISVIEGSPSPQPITPTTPPNTMALASIRISPYPSLSPAYAIQMNRKDLAVSVKKTSFARHTMRDIGVLKERIQNLEYYSALSLLEKQASDMAILDENGLDRFKNGIFVDNFRDHSQGNINNPDYKIVVDPEEFSIRPHFDMDDVAYDYVSGSNVQKTNNMLTLPYTEVPFITQPYATTTRNAENNVYRYLGLMTLNPETDVWVDTQQMPDNFIGTPRPESVPPVQTEWNSWQTAITGYKVYNNGQLIHTEYGNDRFAELRARQAGQTWIGNNFFGSRGASTSLTIQQFSEQTRTGTKTTAQESGTVENLGNLLRDTSLIPYIRPQIIMVSIRDMKPNTRLWVYFDEEKMSDYLTPADSSFNATGAEGSNWVSDANGKAYGLLRIPVDGKKFRVGTKKVRVSDSPTDNDQTTTFAVGYFVAQGLLQQKQETVLSTYQVTMTQEDISETNSWVGSTQVIPTISRDQVSRGRNDTGPAASCLGYSFLVNEPDSEGVFITSIDVFLAGKHATLGTWYEIREVNSAGGITRNTVPYSLVWLDPDEMAISEDSSVAQNIKFPAPVFLYNNTQYALVLHATDMNPDTYFWTCELGEEDVLTGSKVVNRKQTGTLYDTNNNLDWVAVPNQDLKVIFYRAQFDTNVTGQANFGNQRMEKLLMTSVSSEFQYIGEKVRGQNKLTLAGPTTTIVTGDTILGQTSGAESEIVAINGAEYTMLSTTVQNYVAEEIVTIKSSGGATKGTATIATISYPSGTLYSYKEFDANTVHIQLRDTNGTFSAGETIIGVQSGDYGVIGSFLPIKYSTVNFEPNYLEFPGTNLAFNMRGTSNNNILDSAATGVNVRDNTHYSYEKVILGRTNEVALLSGNRSNQVTATMNSATPYLSPIIDLNRSHSVYVHNIVNNDTTGETDANGGNTQNKYISKTITLAEGQDAEDLQVYVTAYRPPGTDVKVYAKIANSEDSDMFDDHKWIELVSSTNNYSSIANKSDFIEMMYTFDEDMMTGLYEAVEYENSKGVKFSGFKHFAVKIGLTSANSALVPRVSDLRLIGLQK